MARLFEPFSKGANRPGEEPNTGLGLWICRSMVELHGGYIWVNSRSLSLSAAVLHDTGTMLLHACIDAEITEHAFQHHLEEAADQPSERSAPGAY